MSDEATRLKALRSYRILDTEPERAFDDLTMIASQICGTPIALITLVDKDRQWFKSRVGIEVRETERSVSFCAHAIKQPGIFQVPDATKDERFRDNPFVTGEPRIRFYAGKPLLSREGEALGTICVVDLSPRTLTEGQREALEALQRQVEALLELRRNLDELRVAIDGLGTLSALIPYCSTCELNIVIPADLASMGKVRAGVKELLTSKGWARPSLMKVELAVEEALANAIHHGCKDDASKRVQCCVSFDAAGDLVIVVRDPGPGFDVKAVPDPLQDENLSKPSGRGVLLINHMMDSVEFSDGGRQVMMRKHAEGARATAR